MPLHAAMSDQRRFAVVILAAGQGTRMQSDPHKVLHPIAGRPMLLHLLDTRRRARRRQAASSSSARAASRSRRRSPAAASTVAVQAEQQGTGHAVQQAAEALAGFDGPVLILYGDAPFVAAETLRRMLDRLDGDDGPGVVVLASSPADPLELRPDHPRRRRPHRQDGRV